MNSSLNCKSYEVCKAHRDLSAIYTRKAVGKISIVDRDLCELCALTKIVNEALRGEGSIEDTGSWDFIKDTVTRISDKSQCTYLVELVARSGARTSSFVEVLNRALKGKGFRGGSVHEWKVNTLKDGWVQLLLWI
jgi:hypothetical protein